MPGSDLQVQTPLLEVDEATRSRRIAEMETWLGRLIGRFHFDGRQLHIRGWNRIHGEADCSRFGEGAGVRCVIRLQNPTPVMRLAEFHVEGMRENSYLPLVYFGINAANLEIQAIVVDLEQVSAQSGALTGDTVRFADNWKACLKTWAHCWMVDEITAGGEGQFFMRHAIDLWAQGSKGPPAGLLKSGHSTELEMQFSRAPPPDTHSPGNAP